MSRSWKQKFGDNSHFTGFGKGKANHEAITSEKRQEMDRLEEHIRRVNEKLQQVLKQYQLLQKENEKLKRDAQEAVRLYGELQAESDKWQQQSEILKLSKGEMNEAEKKAFEKRLNQYVKEIDRCISLLKE